jgi:hypothetical protein
LCFGCVLNCFFAGFARVVSTETQLTMMLP